MIIVRPAAEKDLESIIKIAELATLGMTNLPKNPLTLNERLHNSLKSFSSEDPRKENNEPFFLFVLEDQANGVIGGVSAICLKDFKKSENFYYEVKTQPGIPFHNYKIEEQKILESIHELPFGMCSEICALYLLPEYRKEGLGKLLSLSRLLFMATELYDFGKYIMAEMRGVIYPNMYSPFWEGLGRHFCDVSYEEVTHYFPLKREEAAILLPKFPIYTSLLPKESQDAIGEIHRQTRPALKMLMDEGFELTPFIDPFDAGPIIAIERGRARTIRETNTVKVGKLVQENTDQPTHIITNKEKQFRSCYGKVTLLPTNDAEISEALADALSLKVGDLLQYFHMESSHHGSLSIN